MTIAINGSGTITGISVGGLNDNIITKNEMATGGAWAPAGTVLQVVNATYSTETSSSSSTLVDTGLTATITPTSSTSKILVLVNHLVCQKQVSVNSALQLKLFRNSTDLTGNNVNSLGYNGITNTNIFSVSMAQVDSPATTSAVIYKTQFASANNGASVEVQRGSAPSYITLMEIAA